MEKINPVVVNTSRALTLVQQALIRAKTTNDLALKQAAETVLSALIVVLRHTDGELPAAVKPYIDLITRKP